MGQVGRGSVGPSKGEGERKAQIKYLAQNFMANSEFRNSFITSECMGMTCEIGIHERDPHHRRGPRHGGSSCMSHRAVCNRALHTACIHASSKVPNTLNWVSKVNAFKEAVH